MIIKGNNVGYPLPDPRKGLEMQGGINMNGQPISGLNEPTANDQAANMGYVNQQMKYVNQQMKKASHRNLLDNSDFTNPVNQRGQTSYVDNWTYTVDRWISSDNNTRVDILSNGIKLSSNNASGKTYIFQLLEKLPPGTYTFAAKFKENTGIVSISNQQTDAGAAVAPTLSDTEGILILNFANPDELSSGNAFVRLCNYTDSGYVIWEWAALYEGEYTAETLPEYQPKGYMVEALNCGALTVHKTLTLSANGWSSSTPYTQTVSVSGILSSDTPHYGVAYSSNAETALAQKEAFAMVDDLDTANGSVKFTCFEEKPEVDLTIQLEVNR